MAVKVDLEKAYDRINWSFLEQVLLAVGFSTHMAKRIMFSIKSARLLSPGMT